MAGHAKKCVEQYCELASKTTQQLYKVSRPCIDDHHFKEEMKSVGELWQVCSQIVLKSLNLARIGRPDILWSVNNWHDRSRNGPKCVTNDYLVWSLTFIIHVTTIIWETFSKRCILGLFQDSDIAGDLEDSKSTSGGTLCILGSHTFFQSVGLHFLGCRIEVGRYSVLGNTTQRSDQRFGQCWLCFLKRTFFSSGSLVVHFGRQRSSDQDDHWDMFPEPTEILLICCLIKSIWTPKSKSNTLTPKTNSQTCWPSEIAHVMNGICFCVGSTLAITVSPIVLKWCRKERKKMQLKKESQQNRSDDEFGLTMQRKGS